MNAFAQLISVNLQIGRPHESAAILEKYFGFKVVKRESKGGCSCITLAMPVSGKGEIELRLCAAADQNASAVTSFEVEDVEKVSEHLKKMKAVVSDVGGSPAGKVIFAKLPGGLALVLSQRPS